MTQLCLALADLCLQMPQQNDYLINLMQQMEEYQPALIQLLTMLPEELGNRDLRLGDNRRNQVEDEYEKMCPAVLDVIYKIFHNSIQNAEIRTRCFKCLQQWIRLGITPASCLTVR